MTTYKPISESSLQELIERRKKHEFFINLIDSELNRRKKIKIIKNDNRQSKIKKTKEISKKDNEIQATINDMKTILNRRNIEFKSNMKKNDLIEIVKKNNLVHVVEEFHKIRIDLKT